MIDFLEIVKPLTIKLPTNKPSSASLALMSIAIRKYPEALLTQFSDLPSTLKYIAGSNIRVCLNEYYIGSALSEIAKITRRSMGNIMYGDYTSNVPEAVIKFKEMNTPVSFEQVDGMKEWYVAYQNLVSSTNDSGFVEINGVYYINPHHKGYVIRLKF